MSSVLCIPTRIFVGYL